jgi:Mn2+/Fe2+ NRAMP family transporter
MAVLSQKIETLSSVPIKEPSDALLWAAVVSVITSVLLWVGRYRFIEFASTVMVVGFTLVTLLTVLALQTKPDWAVSGAELARGLSFRLPPASESLSISPLATALGAFGIIGVGASELIMYPYWCIEKGYARFTGPRDGSPAWIMRARGWMRVMRVDAWTSMLVYTFATLGFFLLGAAVLGRVRLNPQGPEMIRTLAQMYVPVFGPSAHAVFLIGAFAVLYSTFFVAAAGNARMLADGMGLFGLHDGREAARMRWARPISLIWPLVALGLYALVGDPAAMVLLSGIVQATMLPLLGIAALYFRYRRCEPALRPGLLWDVLLWISIAGLVVAGVWAGGSKLYQLFGE